MNGVPGMTFRPSGPEFGLLAPTHVGPVSQPKKPPLICLSSVLVLMSITSTDLLLRSVKYIRPAALSTAAISNEKLVPVVTLGTRIVAINDRKELPPPLPPPLHALSIRQTAKAAAPGQNLVISASLFIALKTEFRISPWKSVSCCPGKPMSTFGSVRRRGHEVAPRRLTIARRERRI